MANMGDSFYESRVAAMAKLSGGGVVGLLGWHDPLGRLWIAPLGSPAPDPDRPMPPVWMLVRRVDDPEELL
jgi:hypothetical protein